VLGGLGSLAGAVVAGLMLGVVQTLAIGYLPSGTSDLILYSVLFLVLVVRPSGIFGACRCRRADWPQMIEFLRSYAPLLDIFLMNCGFAFSQYVVLRSGVFSVATAGFAGLGAYTAGILAARHGLAPGSHCRLQRSSGSPPAFSSPCRSRGCAAPIKRLHPSPSCRSSWHWRSMRKDITGGAMGLNDIPRLVGTWQLLFWVALITYLMVSLNATRIAGPSIDPPGRIVCRVSRHAGAAYHILSFALSGAIGRHVRSAPAFYIFSIEPNQYGFRSLPPRWHLSCWAAVSR